MDVHKNDSFSFIVFFDRGSGRSCNSMVCFNQDIEKERLQSG